MKKAIIFVGALAAACGLAYLCLKWYNKSKITIQVDKLEEAGQKLKEELKLPFEAQYKVVAAIRSGIITDNEEIDINEYIDNAIYLKGIKQDAEASVLYAQMMPMYLNERLAGKNHADARKIFLEYMYKNVVDKATYDKYLADN